MFPETFVQKHLAWSKPGELVFDPFSGRGTTVFEAVLNDRRAAACDTNPVAACVSRAKVNAPTVDALLQRLNELQETPIIRYCKEEKTDFFLLCFHDETYDELMHLRTHLDWENDPVDCFLAAASLGLLHGESHRSPRYFSNRMPRTISTKPDYSVRWWTKNNCVAPRREVFNLLRTEIDYRYVTPPPTTCGRVLHIDARKASEKFPEYEGQVALVITSPPYLDTTNFAEDQWLRLWFLGGAERPNSSLGIDDRHIRREDYWTFLREVWAGMAPMMRSEARVIVRMGGSKLNYDETTEGLERSLVEGLKTKVLLVEKRVSDITGGQLRSFRPNAAGTKVEYDYHFAVG
jgi:hypothetical protein